MAIDALMQKQGEGRMYVPPAKVQQFFAEGWVILEPADPLPVVKQVAELPELPPVEPSQTGKARKGRNAHSTHQGNG